MVCRAQTGRPIELPWQERIHNNIAKITALEAAQGSGRDLGYTWAMLGAEYSTAGEFTNSENAYNHAIQYLENDSAELMLYADVLDQLGSLYRIYMRLPEAMNCRKKALEVRERLGDPVEIARSQSHLAEMKLILHHYKESFHEADLAYQTMIKTPGFEKDWDRSDLVSALIVRSYAQCGLHRTNECLADARHALSIARAAFPEGSVPVCAALVAVGEAELKSGDAADGEASLRQAIEGYRLQFSPADPRFTYTMLLYRDCLKAEHRDAEAKKVEWELSQTEHASMRPCAQCTVSAYALRGP